MISHIEIYIENWKQELEFWNKIKSILNLEITHTWKTGFSVGDQNNYISFDQTNNNDHVFKRTNVGVNHIALFANSSYQDIVCFLQKNNIKILYPNKVEENVYIENDWGLKIEIIPKPNNN